ncbi:hypothetical protein HZS61_004084 [Fusarium oxysporum f. sp. conglutinans]|uniref:Uncharacterized protein n=1 Tax=Fusarium oxysporum f. sp. conglutinans TaxID=100902 RepID=A0A8H6GFX6_FUSOX|nr:hypothetical protein HZS61_004084 [Fusarium oxysporum f. sp. conglutinans]
MTVAPLSAPALVGTWVGTHSNQAQVGLKKKPCYQFTLGLAPSHIHSLRKPLCFYSETRLCFLSSEAKKKDAWSTLLFNPGCASQHESRHFAGPPLHQYHCYSFHQNEPPLNSSPSYPRG